MKTVVTDGMAPFFAVLQHVQGLALSDNTIFHDTSFDSFLRFTDQLLHINIFWTHVLIYVAKALLAVASVLVMLKLVRNQAFFKGDERGSRMLNGVPPLFILFTLASPVVWEHHGVFVALPFVLMLKRLELPSAWLWFGFAYLLEFLLPTFDFYPWSFGRLIAPIIVLWLMWRTTAGEAESSLFTRLNGWFNQLPALARAA